MGNDVEIQRASASDASPKDVDFEKWVDLVLLNQDRQGSIVIRLVDEVESQSLNDQYRHKNAPTNVLSFPFEMPVEIESEEISVHLGDLIICVPIVNNEAVLQGKSANAHWVHMVIHGVLHLLGYDHSDEDEAIEMEALEIELLNQLGINNPYEEKEK